MTAVCFRFLELKPFTEIFSAEQEFINIFQANVVIAGFVHFSIFVKLDRDL